MRDERGKDSGAGLRGQPDRHASKIPAGTPVLSAANHEFLKNGGAGGRNLDARVLFHYMATVITPAMVNKMVGAGSQYALLNVDKNGEYMDGAKTYRLKIPAHVPAKDFWSIVAYDPQTRAQSFFLKSG